MTSQTEIAPRLPLFQLIPDDYAAMRKLSDTATELALKASIDEETIHLLKIRVSQINACPFCVDMHTIDARAALVREQRIYLLNCWLHCQGIYTPQERAALRLAESITLLADDGVSDEAHDGAREVCSPKNRSAISSSCRP